MKTIAQKIKAIIFDMDGTIIKTEDLWEEAKADAVISLGERTPNQEDRLFLKSLAGLNLQEHGIRMKEAFNLPCSIEEILQCIATCANKRFDQSILFVEGFEVFHQKLQLANIPSAVATNTNIINLTTLARKLDLERFFGSHIYSQEHAGYKPKPDPAVFFHAAEKLGATPESCIVFEDSFFGFRAAQAAGMTCIAIKNDTNIAARHLVAAAIDNYHEAEAAIKATLSQFDVHQASRLITPKAPVENNNSQN